MKTLQLHTGGHNRSNYDLTHLNDAIGQLQQVIHAALGNGNSVIILSGIEVTLSSTIDISAGWIAVDGVIYYCAGGSVGSGLTPYLAVTTAYPAYNPVVYADGNSKNVHADITLTLYGAASPSNPSDIDLLGGGAVRIGEALANIIGFDPADYLSSSLSYLTSAMSPWRYVGLSGQPTFIGGASNWNATEKVRFMKDQTNTVWLNGLIQVPSAGTGDMFTLPSGYVPSQKTTFGCWGMAGSTPFIAQVIINVSGDVSNGIQFIGTSGLPSGTTYIDLSGVSFKSY